MAGSGLSDIKKPGRFFNLSGFWVNKEI